MGTSRIICSRCGGINPLDSTKCRKCHGSITPAESPSPMTASSPEPTLSAPGPANPSLEAICPKCRTANPVANDFCGSCGASLESAQVVEPANVPPEGRAQVGTPEAGAPKRRRSRLAVAILIAIAVCLVTIYVLKIGVYTVQPIGALPEGATMVVWRSGEEPIFNSPDAMCLMVAGEVSLLCRGIALGQAPIDRTIIKLPYMKWAYLMSTGGREFDR